MNFPMDLKYTKTYEWVKIKGNILTIGLTAFAIKELQGINHVYVNERVSGTFYGPGVELQPIEENDFRDEKVRRGTKFLAGKTVTEIDASKDVVYVYSPVKGKIIEMNARVNEEVERGPGEFCLLIEKDPYIEGWIAKIEILDQTSLIPLMTAQEFQKFLEEEEGQW